MIALIEHDYCEKELADRYKNIRPAAKKQSMQARLAREGKWLEKNPDYIPKVGTIKPARERMHERRKERMLEKERKNASCAKERKNACFAYCAVL